MKPQSRAEKNVQSLKPRKTQIQNQFDKNETIQYFLKGKGLETFHIEETQMPIKI